ncbi:hypothetical protein BVY01_03185 [bacterium I07]|nr:hypothetical protein BVY01_03185 [bacterium I07]
MNSNLHSIRIDREKCVGCVACLKACPTRAIRVREGKAIILDDRCVDCAECYRVCPHDAVIPLTTSFSHLERFSYTVAVPSPAIYTQFDHEVMPNQVLLALLKIGFDRVYDEAWMCEMVSGAINTALDIHPEPRPKISTACPSVIRLVSLLYPELKDHIIPIESPRELAAKLIREKISKKQNLPPEEIGIIHITVCPAKMVSINHPIGLLRSHLDGAISFMDIYPRLLKAVKEVDEDVILQQASGVGLGWAMAGGESDGLNRENCLAVSGVSDVIHILDQVMAGKMNDLEYLECLTCPAGCVGGPLNIKNKHLAKKRAQSLVKMYGEKSRVSRKMIQRLFDDRFFYMEKAIEPEPLPALDKNPAVAIEKRKRMEEIIGELGGKECGACGSPDCKTLAMDIVLGQASVEDCVFVKRQ